MDQKIINLYDSYTHSQLSRNDFIKKLSILTGGVAVAMTILPLLENNYAGAASFVNQEMLSTEMMSYQGVNGEMKGYLAKPKNGKNLGCVMVIHENRGLNPHTMDVIRQVAAAGFLALGVDALSITGGTPADEDKARDEIGKLNPEDNLQNFLLGLKYLRNHKDGNGKVGCVGFCWGGRMSNMLAVNDPELLAAVAYYGAQVEAAKVQKIKASILLHYAGLDERINVGIPAFEAALKQHQIHYQLFIYEGVNHAFNNNTSPTRYNEEAAKLAWSRTIDLFTKKLS